MSERDRSCESGQERHESYRIVRLLTDAAGRFLDHGKKLHALEFFIVARERQDHASADLEIAQQRGRHLPGGRRDENAIDLEILAEVSGAITVLDAHVADLERTQVPASLGDQRGNALDRVD